MTTQGQFAVLPAGHPLCGRPHLRLLPQPRWPRSDGTYPDGPGPQVHSSDQLRQHIGLGRTKLRGGHAVVPLIDAPPLTTVIAWPPQSTSLALATLVRTAVRL